MNIHLIGDGVGEVLQLGLIPTVGERIVLAPPDGRELRVESVKYYVGRNGGVERVEAQVAVVR